MLKEDRYQEENREKFIELIRKKSDIEMEYFIPCQIPIAVADVEITERVVQDYNVFSVLLLRLFDIGFKTAEQISKISGMSINTVNNYIEKERSGLNHIDIDGNLTELGRETLEKNNQNDGALPQSVEDFKTIRRIHIDAVTGTVVPYHLEQEYSNDIKPNADIGSFILPRKEINTDDDFEKSVIERIEDEVNSLINEGVSDQLKEQLDKELKENLSNYAKHNYIEYSNVLNSDCEPKITSVRIIFRWAYIVKLDKMRYPMIVLTGKKSALNNDNFKTNIFVVEPLAISQSDCEYLENCGIVFDDVVVRNDACFDFLLEETNKIHEHKVEVDDK